MRKGGNLKRAWWLVSLPASILILGIFGSRAWCVNDDVLSIGVPAFSEEMNVAYDQSIAASVLRELGTSPLLVSSLRDSGGYILSLVDKFSVEQRPSRWVVRLRTSATFSNGRRVRANDVLWSLAECSNRSGKMVLKAHLVPAKDGEEAETVLIAPVDGAVADAERLLHECPIMEQESSSIFGSHLGEGFSFVSTGPFLPLAFRPGRDFEFRRAVLRKGFPGVVVVKGTTSSEQGLEALRVGTVDVLIGLNEEVAKKVEKDETLLLVQCSITKVAIRRGLSFPCKEKFNLKDARYARS